MKKQCVLRNEDANNVIRVIAPTRFVLFLFVFGGGGGGLPCYIVPETYYTVTNSEIYTLKF